VIAAPGGLMVTTAAQAATWEQSAEGADDLEAAVREALTFGRDAARRFESVHQWSAAAGDDRPRELADLMHTLLAERDGAWTDWEPVAGADGGMAVVRTAVLVPLAVVLAACAGCLGWLVLRRLRRRWRTRLLLAALFAGAAALVWVPHTFYPLVWLPAAGLALAYLWTLVRGDAPAAPAPSRAGSGVAAASAVVLLGAALLAGGTTTAQEKPAHYPVFLLSAQRDGAGGPDALVPLELLRELERITAAAAEAAPQALILSAHYDRGTVQDEHAHFVAEFQVYCFADKARLGLPLSGVELQDGTLVDGAIGFPVPQQAPKKG
jgi:hypothetical protein